MARVNDGLGAARPDEVRLLGYFRELHDGRLPFANLTSSLAFDLDRLEEGGRSHSAGPAKVPGTGARPSSSSA